MSQLSGTEGEIRKNRNYPKFQKTKVHGHAANLFFSIKCVHK